jgi:small subunit ribosomal protein S18
MAKKKAPKTCYFTDNQVRPDYKDYQTLKAFMSPQAKIVAKRRTGTRSSHQRELTQAIKRARFLAIVPFVTR